MGRGRDCATGRGGVDALPLPLVWFCPRVIRVRIRKQGKGSAAAATGGARQGTPVRQQGDAPRLPPEGAVPGPAVGGGRGNDSGGGGPCRWSIVVNTRIFLPSAPDPEMTMTLKAMKYSSTCDVEFVHPGAMPSFVSRQYVVAYHVGGLAVPVPTAGGRGGGGGSRL